MNTPERTLPLSGTTNFRDLGGYAGRDGRALRWGRIFRSDHLGALGPQDVRRLEAMGLRRVVDFRGQGERDAHTCALPSAQVHSVPIEPAVVQDMEALLSSGVLPGAAEVEELMRKTYRDFVSESSGQFALFFERLLEEDSPLVFHCTAGKDRTGLAAALLLTALGVSWPQVMQDYLLSHGRYRPAPDAVHRLPRPALEAMWGVQAGYLEAALDVIEARHGGLRHYLRDALRLGPEAIEHLQARYLEPDRRA